MSVDIQDIQGLMEVMRGINDTNLDIIIHSPGGSLEGAEAFVNYLRSKFKHIRAIVPHAAMSAATMICMACDEIVMGKHSFLGPIDPQFSMQTALGARMVPVQAVVEQFELAKKEIKEDPSKLAAWAPMLSQYGPDLLVQCNNASTLSLNLVTQWLSTYMFAKDAAKASEVAQWLWDHSEHKSHSRFLDRDKLSARGIVIKHLEDNQQFQDAVLSVYHAVTLTFGHSGVTKLIQNHLGKLYLNSAAPVQQKQNPLAGLMPLLMGAGGLSFGPGPLPPGPPQV
ncbi:SDH family Clp fold serine proteinase [Robbsia andropogonis]|uniref:SDH family Clp fold serine proteinase n=1 Tax=Robbsia andropogonis TaxID=28092 RepID=UPI003D1DAB82